MFENLHRTLDLQLSKEEADKLLKKVLFPENVEVDDASESMRSELMTAALLNENRFADALPYALKFTELNLGSAKAWTNLGAIYIQLGKYKEAENCTVYALALNPESAAAKANFAGIQEAYGRHEQCIDLYDDLLKARPTDYGLRYDRSLALLLRGRLEEGWREYECRFEKPQSKIFYNLFSLPYWNGEDLTDKKVLIWTEQGLGDEVLMASMFNEIIALAKETVIFCTARLQPLFQRSFPKAKVIGRSLEYKEIEKDCDFQLSYSHMGKFLRKSMLDFHGKCPREGYLIAHGQETLWLRDKYQRLSSGRKIIGLCWKSTNPQVGDKKSISLDEFAPYLQKTNAFFVSLNAEPMTEEEKALNLVFEDASIDPMKNMDLFAAQIEACDEIISISSTTAHVAGALGKKVSILVPVGRARLWYWFLGNYESPWYWNARLFRQTEMDTWADALRELWELKDTAIIIL